MSSGIIASSSSQVDVRSAEAMHSSTSQVARFAWSTLACNVAVVLWGAYVRATGSGAGCGNKWPLCGGIVGASAKAQTVIEFAHRATSGVALLMVGGLAVWCWRVTTKRDWARYSALLAAVLVVNEALLGAALVLLGHVAQDKSSGRILFLCLHFGNTLLLLAMLALTASWLREPTIVFTVTRKPRDVIAIGGGLFATMLIEITGAVAALGDTLFPATSLRSSLVQDLSSSAPSLLHLRLIHPIAAVIAGTYVLWVVFTLVLRRGQHSGTAIALVSLLFAQIGIGIVNILLLAPVWLQIVHLGAADLLWIVLVIVSADMLVQSAHATATESA